MNESRRRASSKPGGGTMVQRSTAAPGKRARTDTLRAPVQRVAELGVQGAGGALPHHDAIQASFGHHDVSRIEAHVGGAAATASAELGAAAYATGHHVAFASEPSLHTAAHEAA